MSLWFLARDKRNANYRDRRGETLFVDGRKLGSMVDRVHRELSADDIAKVAQSYHSWRGAPGWGEFVPQPGFVASASLDKVRAHGHVLTPGRYVGSGPGMDDAAVDFELRVSALVAKLEEQLAQSEDLNCKLRRVLRQFGE